MKLWSAHINRWLDRLCLVLGAMVLPLALLLLLQWPLRDWVGAYSREANDTAQWIFAVYVTVAVRHATRQDEHLSTNLLVKTYRARWRWRLARWGHAIAVLPFSCFLLISGWPIMMRSLQGWESFPDTANPGYFIIKCAAWLLGLLITLQAVADAFSGDAP